MKINWFVWALSMIPVVITVDAVSVIVANMLGVNTLWFVPLIFVGAWYGSKLTEPLWLKRY